MFNTSLEKILEININIPRTLALERGQEDSLSATTTPILKQMKGKRTVLICALCT